MPVIDMRLPENYNSLPSKYPGTPYAEYLCFASSGTDAQEALEKLTIERWTPSNAMTYDARVIKSEMVSYSSGHRAYWITWAVTFHDDDEGERPVHLNATVIDSFIGALPFDGDPKIYIKVLWSNLEHLQCKVFIADKADRSDNWIGDEMDIQKAWAILHEAETLENCHMDWFGHDLVIYNDQVYLGRWAAGFVEVGDPFYTMELVGKDAEWVAQAVNQGIDSHLRAFTRPGEFSQGNGRLYCELDLPALLLLVTRLDEIDDELPSGESPQMLIEDIAGTLGYPEE